MNLRFSTFALAVAFSATSQTIAADAPPRSTDPRVTIELFAESPQIKTPTGIDVDSRGRVFAIECNTHFRPEGYDGHPTDRLLILIDADHDGRCETVKTFADGFQFAMSVAVRPVWLDSVRLSGEQNPLKVDGLGLKDNSNTQPSTFNLKPSPNPQPFQVFLATRKAIFLLEDTDGDDVCDKQTQLAWLDTKGDYPHNGLAGFAFDALGWMYFGFGENLGAPYTLFSRESLSPVSSVESPEPEKKSVNSNSPSTLNPQRSTTFSGGAEGGNLYRMRPDGTQLSHWATGFWNPHASCVDAFGRLFSVDNDPDSRPPCRLLHIIEGGDYGYKFRNGRKGLHPFTSWNGEVPGTLPMVAGTGEAPSGILAYEHDALPEDYLGRLFVTSWGDHRIDTFVLKNKGASFESVAEPLIVGGENFRPVGIALAPNGSLYCTDWVLRDYKIHGKGRVWRIRPTDASKLAADARKNGEKETDRLKSKILNERRLAAKNIAGTQTGEAGLTAIVLNRSETQRARAEAAFAVVKNSQSVPGKRPFTRDALRSLWFALDDVSEAAFNSIGNCRISIPVADEAFVVLGHIPTDQDSFCTYMDLPRNHVEMQEELAVALLNLERQRFREPETGNSLCHPGLTAAYMTSDPFVTAAAINICASSLHAKKIFGTPSEPSQTSEYPFALTYRAIYPHDTNIALGLLKNMNPQIRRVAVQWAAEEDMKDLRPQVEAVLKSEPMTPELFLATLAALEMLDGKAPQDFDKTPPGKYVLPLLKDDKTPPAIRIQALKLIDPTDGSLGIDLLTKLSQSEDPQLKLEAVRTLALSNRPEAMNPLVEIVATPPASNRDPTMPIYEEAVLGLAGFVQNPATSERATGILLAALTHITGSKADADLAHEIALSLRPKASDPAVAAALKTEQQAVPASAGTSPQNDGDWRAALAAATNDDQQTAAMRGRIVFFHPNSAGCAKCHTVDGRGGKIGPDLSRAGSMFSREKLIDSILEPSKEISPQFTNWSMIATDGRVHTGMIVNENEGVTVLGQTDGTLVTLKTVDVEERTPQTTSVMPEKLEEKLTTRDFRDLLAFLQSLK
ncbi:PVC-type heme-binding CxxCH protein [Planctomicrobium piriforme]|uniref:Putative membrane-bound dehydrogenase domain-containing protein n=1 Tax=Planctomicrobium piriforme TaxID=1576369 RepID=A0A1I3MW97_9PLAN|nr:PVC-type heme-binding CxxCH protein [Planctomicrobium piriforme]SFJ01394.1 putative membrane-bound dehydrogenase domain-containing protein [Planctomicrobium piriforme]